MLILWINEIIVIGALKYVALVLKIKAWNYERKKKKKNKTQNVDPKLLSVKSGGKKKFFIRYKPLNGLMKALKRIMQRRKNED